MKSPKGAQLEVSFREKSLAREAMILPACPAHRSTKCGAGMLARVAPVLLALFASVNVRAQQECGQAWQRPCDDGMCKQGSVFYRPGKHPGTSPVSLNSCSSLLLRISPLQLRYLLSTDRSLSVCSQHLRCLWGGGTVLLRSSGRMDMRGFFVNLSNLAESLRQCCRQ